MILGVLLLLALLAGCAASPPQVQAPPIPTDIGWQMPQVTTMANVAAHDEAPSFADWEQEAPTDGRLVQANVPVNGVLTLQFRADEQIVEAPFGDQGVLPQGEERAPWTVTLGQAGTKFPMVHVRVTRPGLSTSLTVTTTKRLYVIDLKSVTKSRIRVIRWPDLPASDRVEARLLPHPQAPASYHVVYRICPGDEGCERDKAAPTWRPMTAMEDGHKTYIFFPRNLAVMPAPMLRLIGPTGPEVANARLLESVMVMDHLLNQAELRLGAGGTAEVVTITRQVARRIACPGDLLCPTWPELPRGTGVAFTRP